VATGDKKTGGIVKQPFRMARPVGEPYLSRKKVVSENHLIFGGLTATLSCRRNIRTASPAYLTHSRCGFLLVSGVCYNVFRGTRHLMYCLPFFSVSAASPQRCFLY